MVACTGLVVATIVTGGAATVVTAPALASATSGIATTGVAAGLGASAGATVGASAGVGGVLGAITGAATGGSAGASAVGAGVGAASSTATSGVLVGLTTGPIGWAVLGTDLREDVTYDCWKPILHDQSPTPSSGKLLKEIVQDSRIKEVAVDDQQIVLKNVWDENFKIEFFFLPFNNQLAAHATRI